VELIESEIRDINKKTGGVKEEKKEDKSPIKS
jgi:hypothetical protein